MILNYVLTASMRGMIKCSTSMKVKKTNIKKDVISSMETATV